MESTRARFARHGLRCTRQRMAIYETLMSTKSHPTADELYQLVRERDGQLSLATVYNTLEAFSDAGLCRKLPTTSGSVRYDGDTSDHLHLRRRDTGAIHDVPGELGRKLLDNLPRSVLRDIEKKLGVEIHDVRIELIGAGASNGQA